MPPRPLSVSTAAFDGYPIERAFEEIAGLGVACVEPAFIKGYVDFTEATFSEASAIRLSRAMAQAGVRAFAVSAHVNAGVPDGGDLLRRRIAFAQAIGAGILITNAAPRAALAALRDALGAALPACEAAGVVLALENPGHGTGDLLGDGADGAALLAALPSPWLRLNYDIGNIVTYSDGRVRPEADLPAALPHLAHCHAKDMRLEDGGWVFTAIGEGLVDYAAVGALLARAAPSLPVGLELPLRLVRPGKAAPVRRPEPLPLPVIREAVSRSLAAWRRLCPDGG